MDYNNKTIELKCATCGDSEFEYNKDKSWIKCNRCGREYHGGYDELVQLNTQTINEEIKKTKEGLKSDLQKEFASMIKKTIKGNKNIKFK